MKSVALTDSVQPEEDYVLVQALDACSETGDICDGDESSYDNCDDAYSLYSAPQSFAIDSQALQTFHDDFFDPTLTSFDESLGEENSTDEFKILLQGISSISPVTDLATDHLDPRLPGLSPLSEKSLLALDDLLDPLWQIGGGAIADVDDSTTGYDEAPTIDADDEGKAELPREDRDEVEDAFGGEESAEDRALELSSIEDETAEAVAEDVDRKMMSSRASRRSNKKRRKQLKLAKKAAAAAAAAAAISHLAMTTTNRQPTPAKNKQIQRLARKKSRKQVSSVAVSCATKSILSYKQDCYLRSKKSR